MKKRSKRFKIIEKKKIKEKISLDKIFDLIKDNCTSKFNESIDNDSQSIVTSKKCASYTKNG